MTYEGLEMAGRIGRVVPCQSGRAVGGSGHAFLDEAEINTRVIL